MVHVITRTSLVALASAAVALAGISVPANAQENCTFTTTGTVNWNVRPSFNSYIEVGFANGASYKHKGGVETRDGIITDNTKIGPNRSFTWPISTAGTNTGAGTVKTGGGVHWQGHNKYSGDDETQIEDNFILDMDLSNLDFSLNGTEGTMYVDYKVREFISLTEQGQFLTGKRGEFAKIVFASAPDLTAANTTVTAKVYLTETGSKIFAGGHGYEPNTEMADVTFNLKNTESCTSPGGSSFLSS